MCCGIKGTSGATKRKKVWFHLKGRAGWLSLLGLRFLQSLPPALKGELQLFCPLLQSTNIFGGDAEPLGGWGGSGSPPAQPHPKKKQEKEDWGRQHQQHHTCERNYSDLSAGLAGEPGSTGSPISNGICSMWPPQVGIPQVHFEPRDP